MSADPIEAAWRQLVDDGWDDPQAHRRFIALAMTQNRLAEAGKRYRAVRDTDGDVARRAEAERQIDAILSKALSTLEVIRTPPAPRRNTALLLVAAAIFLLLVGAATWAVLGGR